MIIIIIIIMMMMMMMMIIIVIAIIIVIVIIIIKITFFFKLTIIQTLLQTHRKIIKVFSSAKNLFGCFNKKIENFFLKAGVHMKTNEI